MEIILVDTLRCQPPSRGRGHRLVVPVTFIVRGDGYPVASSSWTQLSISLANFLAHARTPAFVGIVGLAMCAEKHSECFR